MAITNAAAGATVFTKLKDVPSSYAGHSKKVPRVKTTVDGLEFATILELAGTKIFDGPTAAPATGYLLPWGRIPYYSQTELNSRLTKFFAIVVGNYIYVGGGVDYSNGTSDAYSSKQFWRFEMATKTWTRLADLPRVARFMGNAAAHKGGVIYAHGFNTAAGAKMFEYTIATNTWAEYAGLGVEGNYWTLAACSDFLYMVYGLTLHQRYDYAAHTWSGALTAVPANTRCGGKVGDDIYIVCDPSPYRTYKYNKGTTNWDDQGQNMAGALIPSNSYVEDADALWVVRNDTNRTVYRYTTAGGWVSQYTYGAGTNIQAFWKLIPSGQASGYLLYSGVATPDAYAVHYRFLDYGVWQLVSQALNAGDLITISANGVPVRVDINGVLLFVCEGLITFQIVTAGTYNFTLDKNYSYKDVTIWRSTW